MEVSRNQKNAVGEKPTLLSRPEMGIPANNDIKNHATDERILSSLQAEPLAGKQTKKTANRTNTTLFSILGISVVTAAAGFSGYQYLSGPSTTAQKTVVAARNVTATAIPPVATVPLAAVAVAPAILPEPAQIIAEPGPAVAVVATASPTSSPVPSEAKLTNALEEGVKPQPATIEKALETKEPEKAATKTKKVKAQDDKEATPEAKKKEKSVEKSTPELAQVATTHPAPVKAHRAAVVDEDVNLLAALIAHSDASAVPDRAAARRAPAAAAKASAASDLEKEKKSKEAKKLKKEKKAAKEKAAAEKKKKLLTKAADI